MEDIQKTGEFTFRKATEEDALEISLLYHKVYHGNYSDPLMREVGLLTAFIAQPENIWVIIEKEGKPVGAVVYETDKTNRLAKAFGGIVLPGYRGKKLLENE